MEEVRTGLETNLTPLAVFMAACSPLEYTVKVKVRAKRAETPHQLTHFSIFIKHITQLLLKRSYIKAYINTVFDFLTWIQCTRSHSSSQTPCSCTQIELAPECFLPKKKQKNWETPEIMRGVF